MNVPDDIGIDFDVVGLESYPTRSVAFRCYCTSEPTNKQPGCYRLVGLESYPTRSVAFRCYCTSEPTNKQPGCYRLVGLESYPTLR